MPASCRSQAPPEDAEVCKPTDSPATSLPVPVKLESSCGTPQEEPWELNNLVNNTPDSVGIKIAHLCSPAVNCDTLLTLHQLTSVAAKVSKVPYVLHMDRQQTWMSSHSSSGSSRLFAVAQSSGLTLWVLMPVAAEEQRAGRLLKDIQN